MSYQRWNESDHENNHHANNLPPIFLGRALVTLFRKMRPFSNSGVFFFLAEGAPGVLRGEGTPGFFKIELLLLTFLLLGPVGVYSLQQRIIFSKRKT